MALTPLTKYPNFGSIRAVPLLGYPSTVANGTTWNSDLMPAGFGGAAAGVLSDHALTMVLQRYADLAGVLPMGAALTQAVSAGIAAWVGANDGLPFVSFTVTLQNASGALATLSSFVILTGGVGLGN